MTIQQIVPPAQIENELLKIWDSLNHTHQMRASLFNLIIFNSLSNRTDYIRSITQKIIETFPCRVLFVSHDPDPSKNYLKTAVSVVLSQNKNGAGCDNIDIGVAGSDWERVPYVILPHILPDLPVYLLWAEDPTEQHPLFAPLASLATRIIFDSESADSLMGFSEALLDLNKQKGHDVADLNWARMEGWRDLLASTFSIKERIDDLHAIKELNIVYNAQETEFFCHLKIQAMYIVALFSARLHWTLETVGKEERAFRFTFANGITATIRPTFWDNLPPGSILSMDLSTHTESHYQFTRIPKIPHQITVQLSTSERCELPYQFILRKSATGRSLVREIFLKGTSPFFVQILQQMKILDRERIC